ESRSLEINGSVEFKDIEEGSYSVELSGLAAGCTIEGDNPVTVDVVAEETAAVGFDVICKKAAAESKIVFFSDRDGDEEIFLMDPDGSNVQQLTDNRTSDYHPSVSNDGTQIAFVRGDRSLVVMDIDGSNVRELNKSFNRISYP